MIFGEYCSIIREFNGVRKMKRWILGIFLIIFSGVELRGQDAYTLRGRSELLVPNRFEEEEVKFKEEDIWDEKKILEGLRDEENEISVRLREELGIGEGKELGKGDLVKILNAGLGMEWVGGLGEGLGLEELVEGLKRVQRNYVILQKNYEGLKGWFPEGGGFWKRELREGEEAEEYLEGMEERLGVREGREVSLEVEFGKGERKAKRKAKRKVRIIGLKIMDGRVGDRYRYRIEGGFGWGGEYGGEYEGEVEGVRVDDRVNWLVEGKIKRGGEEVGEWEGSVSFRARGGVLDRGELVCFVKVLGVKGWEYMRVRGGMGMGMMRLEVLDGNGRVRGDIVVDIGGVLEGLLD